MTSQPLDSGLIYAEYILRLWLRLSLRLDLMKSPLSWAATCLQIIHPRCCCTIGREFCCDLNSQGILACNSASIGILDGQHGEVGLVHKNWTQSHLFVLRSSFLYRLKLCLHVKIVVFSSSSLAQTRSSRFSSYKKKEI